MNSGRDARQLYNSYFNRPLRNPMLPNVIPDLVDMAAREKGTTEAYCFKYQTRTAEVASFADVKKDSDQLASAFIELGLEAGERVAVAGDNCLDWLLCELGALKAGLVVVRVPVGVEPEQLDLLVEHFQIRMLLFYPGDNNEYFHKLQSGLPVYFKAKPGNLELKRPHCLEHVVMMVRGKTQDCRTLGHLLTATFNQRKVMARQSAVDPDDIAVILISPGPGHAVKCVGQTHFTLVNLLTISFSQLNPSKEDKVLVSTPLSSRAMDYYLPLISHVGIIAIRGYKMSGDIGIKFAVRVIEREKINAICFGPHMLEEFACYLRDSDQKELFIHWGRVVGEISQEIYKLALTYIPGLIVVYGMLENLAIGQTCMHDFTDKKLEYTGIPTPGTELKVTGSNKAIAAINEIGEIFVRSVFRGRAVDHYNPSSRLSCTPLVEIDKNGWLRTGDVGSLCSDGHLRVMGVRADLIERGNIKYYARAIQETLLTHPYIENASVIGVPDKLFTQKICAFVKPTKSSKAAGEVKSEKLKGYCEQRGTLVDYFIMDDAGAETEDKEKLMQTAVQQLNLQ